MTIMPESAGTSSTDRAGSSQQVAPTTMAAARTFREVVFMIFSLNGIRPHSGMSRQNGGG